MAWFECQCKNYFEADFTYDVHDLFCPVCGKKGRAGIAKGDLRNIILQKEEKSLTVSLDEQLEALEASKTSLLAELKSYENRYDGIPKSDKASVGHILSKIRDNKNRMAVVDEKIIATAADIARVKNNNRPNRDGADKVYKDAYNAQSRSKKNKLYIGSKQYVSQHAALKLGREKRILDSNVWTWGLNVAWVEGGINARAHFKIKVTGSDSQNAYAKLPDAAIDWLKLHAKNTNRKAPPEDIQESFLEMCRVEGRGSLLWYDLGGADRPTWTALEICCLLRRGYHFDIQKKGEKQKLYLLPPP